MKTSDGFEQVDTEPLSAWDLIDAMWERAIVAVLCIGIGMIIFGLAMFAGWRS